MREETTTTMMLPMRIMIIIILLTIVREGRLLGDAVDSVLEKRFSLPRVDAVPDAFLELSDMVARRVVTAVGGGDQRGLAGVEVVAISNALSVKLTGDFLLVLLV